MARMRPNAALNASHPALAPLIAAGFDAQRIEQVLRFYDEPHRRYHDRRHLREMFDAAVAFALALTPAQAMAVLFHDAVYVPGAARGLNETLSAHLLRVWGGDLRSDVVDVACGIVLDTADHLPRGRAAEAVLDLDLMRLAAPRSRFARYSRAVFAEHRPLIAVEDDDEAWDIFARRRAEFFERLLARPAIFCTSLLRSRFEASTRSNLREAIDSVKATGTHGMP